VLCFSRKQRSAQLSDLSTNRVYDCKAKRWSRRVKYVLLAAVLVFGGFSYFVSSWLALGLVPVGSLLLWGWLTKPTTFQFGDDALFLYAGPRTIQIKYNQIRPWLSAIAGSEDLSFVYQKSDGRMSRVDLRANFFVSRYQSGGISEIEFLQLLKSRCGFQAKPQRLEDSARAASPEIHPQELLALADAYPEEVLRNPALPLFLLEDPTTHQEILLKARRAMLREELRVLPESKRSILAADFIEHLLPPHTPEPFLSAIREALDATRKFSTGNGPQQRMEDACKRAAELFLDISKEHELSFADFSGALVFLYCDPEASVDCLLWSRLEHILWLSARAHQIDTRSAGSHR
jgi:hypothetical protein